MHLRVGRDKTGAGREVHSFGPGAGPRVGLDWGRVVRGAPGIAGGDWAGRVKNKGRVSAKKGQQAHLQAQYPNKGTCKPSFPTSALASPVSQQAHLQAQSAWFILPAI